MSTSIKPLETAEHRRLNAEQEGPFQSWRQWGAYVSERQWGTVREDYSADGNAWKYIPHDMARSRAYRWGEDGIAGICDLHQIMVFSTAFWNEKDSILKERLFGLDPFEGNHGEDVKELYYYLDGTPTHSYLKYLYKYPQEAYPYDQLVASNCKRTAADPEYELIDTGIFKDNRYFDIFIEYAKAGPQDICIRIEAFNRGNDPAKLHILPQLWFRNRWAWSCEPTQLPIVKEGPVDPNYRSLLADASQTDSPWRISYEYHLPQYYLYGDQPDDLLFTHNDTNNPRVFGEWDKSRTPFVKDAFHRYVVNGVDCVNPEKTGTKACFHYKSLTIPPGESVVIRMRLTTEWLDAPLNDVDKIVQERKKEADEYYASIQAPELSQDDKLIQRQALAGMIWTEQSYNYDVSLWLKGDFPDNPPPKSRYCIRNFHWTHLNATNIISMPDKWEYPWFASWDLAFHTLALANVDIDFAKKQVLLLLSHLYQHPNGQIPAYEWGFNDLNPPVQAWAVWKLFQREKKLKGKGDLDFLNACLMKLTYNFGWWVNVVDKMGNNFFEGGFLGLDNISIIDRSKPLPGGGQLEQSDGTGWMAFFALMMMRMSLELARDSKIHYYMAPVFFEHFVFISAAMARNDNRSFHMWDEKDGFFYDIISFPGGHQEQLKVRSLVGIIPFYSIDFIEEEDLAALPHFERTFKLFVKYHPIDTKRCITPIKMNGKTRYLLSLMNPDQMKRVLSYVWDSNEFLSPYGLRSLSKYHEKSPFIYSHFKVGYEPGESLERIKGGNSNWRGPVWVPTTYLLIDALKNLHHALGDQFKVQRTGEEAVTAKQMADSYTQRVINIFRKDPSGRRAVHGKADNYAKDPHWKDLVLFYEHYHGDTGRGLGASHQTGWSGLVASLIAEQNDK